MIAAWWQQYGEFVELRLYRDQAAFEADRDDVLETFSSYNLVKAEHAAFS